MSKTLPTIWTLEPHTKAKHLILQKYIGAWISILGQKFQEVVYVDGFSGPGIYNNGEPGSPILLIKEIDMALRAGLCRKCQKIRIYLFENRKGRFESLEQEVNLLRPSIDSRMEICVEQGEFEDKVIPVVQDLYKNLKLFGVKIPSFYFIDPFGVKGFSLQMVLDIFKLAASEVFLLFDIDGIDRNLMANNRELIDGIYHATDEEIETIKALTTQKERFKALRTLFYKRLREAKVPGVLPPFSMYDKTNKTLYDLVFMTGSLTGFKKMKEAMWKVDETGELRFSDEEHGDQLRFDFKPNTADNLRKLIYNEFKGQKVNGQQVIDFVDMKTIYLSKHRTDALKLSESETLPENERIIVENRVRRGIFPSDCLITFPEYNYG